MRRRLVLWCLAAQGALVISALPAPLASASTEYSHVAYNCAGQRAGYCVDVVDPGFVFGYNNYVGHDEPSMLFYSNQPGSGNQVQWTMRLPKDPPANNPTKNTYNFELHPAFWFGMAVCDPQSAPNPTANANTPCVADSDTNITTDANISHHAGTAFMEMQFYPPGWSKNGAGLTYTSCDARQWCSALNIDSLSVDYVTGQNNNTACLNAAGQEPVNYAIVTRSGAPHAPVAPLNLTADSFTAHRATDLFMNSGDLIQVTMHDTKHGLRIDINDLTTRQSGFMIASAANGFGQVKWDPSGTTCQNIPYDFHPMYSTASENTRVPWAAHTYNIAFSDEIGHFDPCTQVDTVNFPFACLGNEGSGAADPTVDDVFCIDKNDPSVSRIKISGCTASNTGFDGTGYQPVWPDGNKNHPTPIVFTSPTTGEDYNRNYARAAFEVDLPAIESSSPGSPVPGVPCSTNPAQVARYANCTIIPYTDDNQPANFYPFFSSAGHEDRCVWILGNDVPGMTVNDFGRNAQYGTRLLQSLPGIGGVTRIRNENFRQILPSNPCPVSQEDKHGDDTLGV